MMSLCMKTSFSSLERIKRWSSLCTRFLLQYCLYSFPRKKNNANITQFNRITPPDIRTHPVGHNSNRTTYMQAFYHLQRKRRSELPRHTSLGLYNAVNNFPFIPFVSLASFRVRCVSNVWKSIAQRSEEKSHEYVMYMQRVRFCTWTTNFSPLTFAALCHSATDRQVFVIHMHVIYLYGAKYYTIHRASRRRSTLRTARRWSFAPVRPLARSRAQMQSFARKNFYRNNIVIIHLVKSDSI